MAKYSSEIVHGEIERTRYEWKSKLQNMGNPMSHLLIDVCINKFMCTTNVTTGYLWMARLWVMCILFSMLFYDLQIFSMILYQICINFFKIIFRL